MRKGLLLYKMFNFDYAGKASIFITYNNKKYCVVASGIHFVEDIYVFSPHYKRSWKCDKLYTAINIFNKLVEFTVSTLDWYSEDFEKNIYEELFIKD